MSRFINAELKSDSDSDSESEYDTVSWFCWFWTSQKLNSYFIDFE